MSVILHFLVIPNFGQISAINLELFMIHCNIERLFKPPKEYYPTVYPCIERLVWLVFRQSNHGGRLTYIFFIHWKSKMMPTLLSLVAPQVVNISFGSNNGLAPVRRQAIIWNNEDKDNKVRIVSRLSVFSIDSISMVYILKLFTKPECNR